MIVSPRTHRQAAISVVEDDLDVGRDDPGPRALVQQCLSLLGPEVRVLVGQDELDRVEEVGFSRPVSTDDDVVSGVERLDDRLLAVGLEALDDDLLDVHGDGQRRPTTKSRTKVSLSCFHSLSVNNRLLFF